MSQIIGTTYSTGAELPYRHSPKNPLVIEAGTIVPSLVWAVIGQRQLVMIFGDENEARTELNDLDDKYQPAYLMRVQTIAATITEVQDVYGELDVPGTTSRQ